MYGLMSSAACTQTVPDTVAYVSPGGTGAPGIAVGGVGGAGGVGEVGLLQAPAPVATHIARINRSAESQLARCPPRRRPRAYTNRQIRLVRPASQYQSTPLLSTSRPCGSGSVSFDNWILATISPSRRVQLVDGAVIRVDAPDHALVPRQSVRPGSGAGRGDASDDFAGLRLHQENPSGRRNRHPVLALDPLHAVPARWRVGLGIHPSVEA